MPTWLTARPAEAQAEAKKLAFYLYHNVKPLGAKRHHILLTDFEDIMATPDAAQEAFDMLNSGNRDRISQHVRDVRDPLSAMRQLASRHFQRLPPYCRSPPATGKASGAWQFQFASSNLAKKLFQARKPRPALMLPHCC